MIDIHYLHIYNFIYTKILFNTQCELSGQQAALAIPQHPQLVPSQQHVFPSGQAYVESHSTIL